MQKLFSGDLNGDWFMAEFQSLLTRTVVTWSADKETFFLASANDQTKLNCDC